jgi:hypothetical protein
LSSTYLRRVTRGAALAVALATSPPIAAQSLGSLPPGYQEYLALLGTPVASLPPLGTYTLIGIAQGSPQVAARYGYVPDIARPLAPEVGGHVARSLDSFGLTGILPIGLDGTVSATVGLANERCDQCSGARFMGSVASDFRLLSASIDNANVSRVTLGTSGEIGIGFPSGARTLSFDVGLPLAFTIGGGPGTQIIPFVTPSFAYVLTRRWLSNDVDVSAGRLLLGAGVSLFNPKSSLGASVGFQYVFVSGTELQLGVSLSFGGR